MIRILVLAAAFALTGCMQISTGPAANAKPAMPVAPETDVACAAAGGTWGRVGLMGTLACTMPSPTAGMACSDSEACAGQCWASEPAGSSAKGMCQPTNMPFGCHAELKNGVAQPALCAD